MTTRDEIIAILTRVDNQTIGGGAYVSMGEAADRILALMPPREPTPAMVEAMARAHYESREPDCSWDDVLPHWQKFQLKAARAAWAAGYAKWEKR
jgi:hypothetical protein